MSPIRGPVAPLTKASAPRIRDSGMAPPAAIALFQLSAKGSATGPTACSLLDRQTARSRHRPRPGGTLAPAILRRARRLERLSAALETAQAVEGEEAGAHPRQMRDAHRGELGDVGALDRDG